MAEKKTQEDLQAEKEMHYSEILSEYKDKDDYICTLYKFDGRKRVMLDRCENYIPDPIDDLRDKYKGGTFRIMIHRNGKLVESADIHIEEQKAPDMEIKNNRRDMLEEIAIMANLFKSEDRNNGNGMEIVLSEMMKMQSENNKMMMEFIQKSNERILSEQKRSEEKIFNLMNEMRKSNQNNSGSDSVQSFIENMRAIEELKASLKEETKENDGNFNMLEFFQTAFEFLKGKKAGNAQITDNSVDSIIAQIPDNLKAILTPENKNEAIQKLKEANQSLSIETCTEVIEKILKGKGML